ncbi:type-1 angiotensin II receptor A [Brachyhypopomus gauderio]|uniref:type-1 angiotensin II receptor A n=1 Tax=Brachyhypopomus gauderio TaxID=698409 RepID=UPI004041D087
MENLTMVNEGVNITCNTSGRHDFIFTFVPVIYACNFLVGVAGNSIVVAVIFRFMKLKTVASVFVLNLAVSDLTFLVTLPMWATFTATGYHWPFGSFLCKASGGLAVFNLYASIFFLTALSVDRYLAVVHPVGSRRHRTPLCARVSCTLVWASALLLSAPAALSRDVHHVKGGAHTLCGVLHDGSRHHLLVTLGVLKSVLGFLTPFLIIITCYCRMGHALLGARGVPRKSSRPREDETLRMLAAAVLAFFVCWAPHQVVHSMDLLAMLNVVTDCHTLDIIDTAMPLSICLAYFNSCVNPVLYGFVGRNFRKNVLRLLRCGPAGTHGSISSRTNTLSQRASKLLHLSSSKKNSEHCAHALEEPKNLQH